MESLAIPSSWRGRRIALLVFLVGGLAGCEGPPRPVADERFAAQALVSDAGAMTDAALPGPNRCGPLDLDLDDDGINDLSLEDVLAELGILWGCEDDEMCCHGTCVRLEDAEAHGC
jgi:hypothetical protein